MGSFTWEFQTIDGKKETRPIFLLSEHFAKDHGVQQSKTIKVPLTAKSEEVNYSKLAIKFSSSLSKDMIYAGLRDLFHKIAAYLEQGREFEIEFSFGVLYSKEKRIRFEFNVQRLTQVTLVILKKIFFFI